MHWTCCFNDLKYTFAQFNNSFGIQPGNETVNYLKTSNKQIAYYSTQVQNFNNVNCGNLCFDYIKRRFKGRDVQNSY